MKVKINLKKDFSVILKEKVKEFEIRLDDLDYYKQIRDDQDINSVCLKFLNLNRRFIPKKSRNIEKSKDFKCPAKYQKNLKNLEKRIEIGEDLTPFLSRKIFKLDFRDALLNDWGIYHLHLGELKDPKKLSEGHDKLLYAYFTTTTAYFIQIFTHKDWYQPRIIDILHNNWPDLIKSYKLPSSIKGESKEEIIKKWRQGGINTAVTVSNGETYMSTGGGITLSLHNNYDVSLCNTIIRRLESIENNIKEKQKEIRDFILSKKQQEFDTLKFGLYSIDLLANNFLILVEEKFSSLIILCDSHSIRMFF